MFSPKIMERILRITLRLLFCLEANNRRPDIISQLWEGDIIRDRGTTLLIGNWLKSISSDETNS